MASYYGTPCVVGGRDAQPGAWPWVVNIQDPCEIGTGHACGGSHISPQWVLMAAHCFIEASNISERNDIALLELDQPVQCSYYIQLACVPDTWLRVSELTTCYISGCSMTARSGGSTDVLQEAKVCLIDVNLCNSSRWYRGAIHTHNLCAGYPQSGIDTCQGDSGSHVYKDNTYDHFWLVGVTSWEGCARAKQPGVYTSIQPFYGWILVVLGTLAAAPPNYRDRSE
ncbi:LOW QUALITY PROTEIN: acrosin-like, partial [Morus bassanus]